MCRDYGESVMLRVLLYGRIKPELKYACVEMLDHLGLPYSEIDDLRGLKGDGDVSDVLILLGTSIVGMEEALAVRLSTIDMRPSIWINYRADVFKRFRISFDEANLQTIFEPKIMNFRSSSEDKYGLR